MLEARAFLAIGRVYRVTSLNDGQGVGAVEIAHGVLLYASGIDEESCRSNDFADISKPQAFER